MGVSAVVTAPRKSQACWLISQITSDILGKYFRDVTLTNWMTEDSRIVTEDLLLLAGEH